MTGYLQGRPTYRRPMEYPNFLDRPMPIPPPPNPNPPQPDKSTGELSTRKSLVYVVLIILCSIGALYTVYQSFPHLTEEERTHVRLPRNIEQAKNLGLVLDHYKNDHFPQVIIGVFVVYIFLQTFAIPGSLFLSILSGFLFPFYLALILVCTCSAVGASLCFLLSQLVGRKLVVKFFPERTAKWAQLVEKNRDHLFNYVLFLRITPFLPNWFINLSAPVVGVPLWPFAFGTFLGVAPPSFVAIQGGKTLYSMSATDSTFSWNSILLLAVFAIVSLIPIFIKQRLKDKFD